VIAQQIHTTSEVFQEQLTLGNIYSGSTGCTTELRVENLEGGAGGGLCQARC
jgi:hypothetical protein